MARDKLAEIAAIRARNRGTPWRGSMEIDTLARQMQGSDASGALLPFVVIRLVTSLEVFSRDWIRQIVDAGDPYIGRAAALVKGSLKIDFAVAQALVGKRVTFGDLVAHEIPVNNIGDIDRAFSQLIDGSLFKRLDHVVDRWAAEVRGEPARPILPDPDLVRARLARLFETRHIVVHELPDDAPLDAETVTNFVDAASAFVTAADQAFSTLLYGNYPLTQLEMNAEAGKRADAAEAELSATLARFGERKARGPLSRAQLAWEVYRKRQAEFRSGINGPSPGSIAPLIYASEYERVTRARIEELELYLDRDEGEL